MAKKPMALALLLDYESDGDSGYTSEEERKRKAHSEVNTNSRKKLRLPDDSDEEMLQEPSPRPLIPLPVELEPGQSEVVKDDSLHDGRIRSFPHEKGTWASLFYIPLACETSQPILSSLISALKEVCSDHHIKMVSTAEFHISLSKTLKLRHHWIQPIVEETRDKLKCFHRFSTWLHGLEVYTNEDKTRTFLGAKVCQGRSEMEEIISEIDSTLRDYKLPTFYEDHAFHMSLASVVGDFSVKIKEILPSLENLCQHYFMLESDVRIFDVKEIYLKAGNKISKIALMDA